MMEMRGNVKNYTIELNVEEIARALWLEPLQVKKEFRDGRVTSRFSEYWAGKLYGFEKEENPNKTGYDGTIDTCSPLIGKVPVGVRSLTGSGIKFQLSKHIGSGRKCVKENLLDSLSLIEFEIVVDITEIPKVLFVPVKSSTLIKLCVEDVLTCNGFNKKKFYSFIDVKEIEFIDIYNLQDVDDGFHHRMKSIKQYFETAIANVRRVNN